MGLDSSRSRSGGCFQEARSALVEATAQLSRALAHIASLQGTQALRREQIKLQVALAIALMHTKGYAAPETRQALEKASSFIDQAGELGEALEDPLLMFSVLFGFYNANIVAFDGNAVRKIAAQISALAEKDSTRQPLMIAHRVTAVSLLLTGNCLEARAHFDHAIALYDLAEDRSGPTRFGQDSRASSLCFRSWDMWLLGYPEAALADASRALADAREIGLVTTIMFALHHVALTHVYCAEFAAARALADELLGLAREKGSRYWEISAKITQGCIMALNGGAADAIDTISSGIQAARATGSTLGSPFKLSCLARGFIRLGRLDDARRAIDEAVSAIEVGQERWGEAEVHRTAAEIALCASDAAAAEDRLKQALNVARMQRARSLELRAGMSMARLWRDQGKRTEARDLLAPIYGWFTEGFDTPDLKEAKVLLDELAS